MSKFTEQLREVGVCNPYQFAGKGVVFVHYASNEYGRITRGARWIVCRPGYQTDPDAHWMDHGCKVFTTFGAKGDSHKEKKESAFHAAIEWVTNRYGIGIWKRTPFGSWMDAEFVKTRIAELKAKLKAQQNA